MAERVQNKDHRSFAANLFGTVAFKMLEWLTPRSIESMSQQISQLDVDQLPRDRSQSEPQQPTLNRTSLNGNSITGLSDIRSETQTGREIPPSSNAVQNSGDGMLQNGAAPTPKVKTKHRGAPKPRSRAASSPRTKRTMSLETVPSAAPTEDSKPAIFPSRMNGYHPEKPSRPPKTPGSIIGRGFPEVPNKPAFFENVPPPNLLPAPRTEVIQPPLETSESEKDSADDLPVVDPAESESRALHEVRITEPATSLLDNNLPQSLSRLSVEIIDFICDVFEEDGTFETYLAQPVTTEPQYPKPRNRAKHLARKRLPSQPLSSPTRQWKGFNEQAIFSVFSDPRALLQSFTRDNKLFDSQSLWYCLHRMTRAAPSLVFHSLWIAADSLFIPHGSTSPKASRKRVPELSSVEAGYLMSICMHALVAATPVVPDSRTLYEMSRLRSSGLILAGGGSITRQPPSRCLEYEDAFSNELAIRLARRLFCAIASRRLRANKPSDHRSHQEETGRQVDVLQPLLEQLDFLSSGFDPVLDFAQPERLLHETRVPTVLLDWSRAVLLKEWDGRTSFKSDSPFGGALSLLETLCKYFVT